MFTELSEYKPVDTPRGKAYAWAIIDYGPESHLLFVCWMKDTGECWTFQNPEIRLEKNETLGIATSRAELRFQHVGDQHPSVDVRL
jgi:hypothetical protein